MSPASWGAVLGAAGGAGLVLVAWTLAFARRPRLADRVLPYLRDLDPGRPLVGGPTRVSLGRAATAWLATRIDRVLGGSHSVRRRLERAALDQTVHGFRVEQALWGLASFAAVALLALVVSLADPGRSVPMALLSLVAFAGGVLLRDNRLSAQATARERRVLLEFPVIAELLALAVAAGEGPAAALERVVRRSRGALSDDLQQVLADVRSGVPLAQAFDALGRRTGLPAVARFADGIAVAVERGTPLADVLHAQAADVRESGRRALIEAGARREILMMVPVVSLVLPVTVVFAFYPGLIGLRLTTP